MIETNNTQDLTILDLEDDPNEYRYSIQGSNEYALLIEESGIWHYEMKKQMNCTHTHVFSLFINNYFEKNDVKYYNGVINNVSFYGFSRDDIILNLNKCCGVKAKSGLTNPLINIYLNKKDILNITDQISEICGYDKDWKLYESLVEMYNDLDEVNKIRRNLFKQNTSITPELKSQYINDFKALYNIMDFEYKDDVLTYGIVAPFLYSLREKLSLLPHLLLVGDRESGKSNISELITCIFYGHLNHIYSSAGLSQARFELFLTSSTFPICVDDVENMPNQYFDVLKSYSTNPSYYMRPFQKKGGKKPNIPYETPLVLTANKPPQMFTKDTASNSRFFVLNVKNSKKRTLEEATRYIECYNKLEKGFMLKLLLDYTNNLKLDPSFNLNEFLIDKLTIGTDIKESSIRNKNMVKIMNLGKFLMKEIFGINVKISPEMFDNSNKMDGDIFELIKTQCIKSQLLSERPMGWIKTQVHLYTTKNKSICYKYTRENLIDLLSVYKDGGSLTLACLARLIQDKYPNIEYKLSSINSNKFQCVIIPYETFQEPDDIKCPLNEKGELTYDEDFGDFQ